MSLVHPRPVAPAPGPPAAPRPRWARLSVVAGALLLPVAVALAVVAPDAGLLVAAALLGGSLAYAGAALVVARPWLAPWLVVALFAFTGELRLRVSPLVGVAKDATLAVLVLAAVIHVHRHRRLLHRLVPLAFPLVSLGVLVGLYVLDPGGSHGSPWLFGTRLLLSVLALLVLGVLSLDPARTLTHLVRAMLVVLPFEAVFSWVQHAAGVDSLVYQWGYQFGAQVRNTSSGGLRTSGTFEDPFQLAALAVVGLAVGLFLTRGWRTGVLLVSAVAVLASTSVRTAMLQAGVLLVIHIVRKGLGRQALLLATVGLVAAVAVLSTVTSSAQPGAPERPLLLTLNGRSTAWSLAVVDWRSLAYGNGVGDRGIGSTRTTTTVSDAPAYSADGAAVDVYAGNSAFLDSSFAQVLSDVGLLGLLAMLLGFGGLALCLLRQVRGDPSNDPAWAGLAILATAAVDWVGRSSLASFTTGYITMFVTGILVAGALQWRTTAPRPTLEAHHVRP